MSEQLMDLVKFGESPQALLKELVQASGFAPAPRLESI